MSALDRHIRKALINGHYEFDDPIAFRFVRIGELQLCKAMFNSWYLPTGLEGGVNLSLLTRLHLDLVRTATMKKARAP